MSGAKAFDSAAIRELTLLGSRNVFGLALQDAAADHPALRTVVADVKTSARLGGFAETAPDRLVNVGIAEQNMIGVAAGLANEGYNVFASSFAPFASLRCFEMLRTLVGYMHLNVKTVGLLSGMTGASFGSTHFGLEDMAVTRTIPNMTVVSPADCLEVYKTIEAAADFEGPMYIRLTGDRGTMGVHKEDYHFEIGRAEILQEGTDVAMIGTGSILGEVMRATRGLAKYGINPTVVNMHTVKPLDIAVLDAVFGNHRLVVTVEEHFKTGGLGSAIAEYKASYANGPAMLVLGVSDEFPHAGSLAFTLNHYGLSAPRIVETVVEKMKSL